MVLFEKLKAYHDEKVTVKCSKYEITGKGKDLIEALDIPQLSMEIISFDRMSRTVNI